MKRKMNQDNINQWTRWNALGKTTLLTFLALFATSCGEDSSTDELETDSTSDTDSSEPENEAAKLPPLDWAVDESIQPFVEELHPMTPGGAARPLSAVGGDDMPTVSFVQNELVVFSDDDDAVDAFIARIDGKLVFTEDPTDSGVQAPRMHLIVVDDPAVETDEMGEDIRTLTIRSLLDNGELIEQVEDDGEHGDEQLLFSDEKGAQLVALAAQEGVVEGLNVAINWVAEPNAIPSNTEEAPDGSGGYFDAYSFDWFERESGMKTGVAEAWNLLHHGNKLDNTVKIAVLDMGFKVTSDLDNVTATTVWPGFGPLNRKNDFPCSGGSDCPWHGTDVAGTAMGIPDNQFGSAGPAGPIAEPVLVYTTYDYIASITAVYRARSKGAKIINMSYSAGVPWWLKWTVAGFRHATSAIRDSGVLLFAAAGNEHRNVDSKICFLGYCWEKTFYTPCENGGVTCVGGLSGPNTIDSGSNYGDKSVDLWGPWCVSVGPNPKDDDFHTSCGTSISSPFVAGVAALVWAANPSLSASDVARILADTADGYREEKVNAYDAVLSAIGTLRDIRINDPAPGSEIVQGIPSPFTADITFVSTPGPAIDVSLTWYSSIDGELGSQDTTVERNEGDVHSERVYFDYSLSEGLHQITVIAEMDHPLDPLGIFPPIFMQDTSNVLVTNPGPSVSIETPAASDVLCEGQSVVFRAVGQDANQTLQNSAYSWTSAVDTTPFPIFYLLGEGAVITTDQLPVGEQRVTVSVTDDQGSSGSDFLDIEVLSANNTLCSNQAPQVAVSSPTNGLVMMATGYDANGTYADVELQAVVSDYEDDDASLTVEWFETNQGSVGAGTDTTARIYMTEPVRSTHTITVRVTDSDANTTEDAVTISIYIVD